MSAPSKTGKKGKSTVTKQYIPGARLKPAKFVFIEAADLARKLMLHEKMNEAPDVQQAFLLYAGFCGDVERTAIALGVTAVDVLRMADADSWNERLMPILKLKNSQRPGDVERAISRTMNFVQAHRMRLFLDRLVSKLTGANDEQLASYCFIRTTKTTRDGLVTVTEAFNTRAVADLTSALEKVHHMLYLSLGDTTPERDRTAEGGDSVATAGQIHATIAEAMAKVGRGPSDAPAQAQAQVFEEKLAEGAPEVAKAVEEKIGAGPAHRRGDDTTFLSRELPSPASPTEGR